MNRRSNVRGLVYLLHFEEPFFGVHRPVDQFGRVRRRRVAGARHYIGWTEGEDEVNRIITHMVGNGSPLLRAVIEAGISISLARTFPNVTRYFERDLKKTRQIHRYCPRCNQIAYNPRILLAREGDRR